MNAQTPETTSQDSRGSRTSRARIPALELLGIFLAIAAFAGAVLLVISDFTTLFRVHTAAGVTVPGGTVKGHDNHSFAMLLLGVAALPLAYWSTRYGSRPAMAGLAGLGLIAIVIAIGFDRADATGTNTLARTFEDATGSPSTGFYMETLGAVLLLISGGGGLVLTAPERAPRRERASGETEAEAGLFDAESDEPEPESEDAEEPGSRREEERAAAAAARAQRRARRQGG